MPYVLEDETPAPALTFEQWKKKYAPNDSGADYDLKGAYDAGLLPGENGHFSDRFKKPNHPTFSIESQYYKPGLPAGRWEGDNYVPMDAPTAAEYVKKNSGRYALDDEPKPKEGWKLPPLVSDKGVVSDLAQGTKDYLLDPLNEAAKKIVPFPDLWKLLPDIVSGKKPSDPNAIMSALANPLPEGVTLGFTAALDGIEKVFGPNGRKTVEDAMTVAPFMTHGPLPKVSDVTRALRPAAKVAERTGEPAFVESVRPAGPAEQSAQVFEDAAAKQERLAQSPKGADLLKRQLAAEESRSARFVLDPVEEAKPLPKEAATGVDPEHLVKPQGEIDAFFEPAKPLTEQTPAGAQAVIPGAEGRSIPKGGLKPKAGQTEKLTDLERATVPDTQGGLDFSKQAETPKEASAGAAYEAAREKISEASRKFAEIEKKYRAKEIGDEEYLAARAEHDAAQKAFDNAEAGLLRKESKGFPTVEVKPLNPGEYGLAAGDKIISRGTSESKMRWMADQINKDPEKYFKAKESAKPKRTGPRLEDSELAPSTYIRRHYVENNGPGIRIPDNLREELGGWNRWHKKDGVPLDDVAESMVSDGLLRPQEGEGPLDALLRQRYEAPAKRGSAGAKLGYTPERAAVESHINEITKTPWELEYKGKKYEGAEVEGSGKIRLKNDPDKVLTTANQILDVKETPPAEAPFDIPGEKPGTKIIEPKDAQVKSYVESLKRAGGRYAGFSDADLEDMARSALRKEVPTTGEYAKLESAIDKAEAAQTAEEAARSAELERGSITLPQANGIHRWLDRTLSTKDLAKGIIREHTGELAQKTEQARAAVEGEIKRWKNASIRDSLTFIDNMEAGRNQTDPRSQPIANTLRQMLDDRRTAVQQLGTGKLEHWIEHYFPHIWEQPGPAQRIFGAIFGKRPLEGPASFLKKRTIPTTADGINAGLKPVTYNPIELALLKTYEMDRYVMAHKIKDTLVDQGLAKFVRFGKKAPDGWSILDDKIFRVLQWSDDEKGFVIRGQYYAPSEAAKVFNNYLSPGLKGNPVYDLVRATGNTLNQAQLAMPSFHAGFTTVETLVSDLSLAIEKASRGDITGAAKPALRFATLASTVENPFIGNRLIKEYLKPGSYPQYAEAAKGLAKAGGRVRMDAFYRNQAIDAFSKALKERDAVTAARKAIPAAFELIAKPVMEKLVPMQKAGIFNKMFEDIIERSRAESWTREKERAEVQKAWDSVDNRAGQMVYDNVFISKRAKDLAFASVRSVGWNLGTIRELGGGALVDLPKEAARAATGRGFEVTHRMAYAVALPITVGYLGSIIHYLYNGKAPEELKDYYYPRTGRKNPDGTDERVQLPSYVKDVVGYMHDFPKSVWDTTKHKIHPLVSAVTEMLDNEDFYKTQIRNPDDPWVKQLGQLAGYMAEQALPFSVRNAQQRAKNVGETSALDLLKPSELPATAQSFVGMTPAPKFITQTPAEQLATRYAAAKSPQGPIPGEQKEKTDLIRTLENRQRLGKLSTEELQGYLARGEIAPKDLQRIMVKSNVPILQREVKSLALDQALNIWDKASDKEKAGLAPLILHKFPLLQKYPMEERGKLKLRMLDVAKQAQALSQSRAAEATK